MTKHYKTHPLESTLREHRHNLGHEYTLEVVPVPKCNEYWVSAETHSLQAEMSIDLGRIDLYGVTQTIQDLTSLLSGKDPAFWKPIGFQGDGESVVSYDPFEAQFFHLKTPWGDGEATIDTNATGIEAFVEFLKLLKSEMEDNL
ncbi:hypothetical protein I6I10_06865 [Corynebacterium glucuronolyticum]|uniref:Uncharacterized protein n=1 Tax=Corynebacterium glucuronolyticum TaxID=39791 RepID=A0A7T4BN60_9CORY|nr:hypothetical protein [Corynebacterium glucuronolyticum]QQB45332.1 hypothetical protein I6I10_07240 [Corynebacterium glucuronolyticum]QQB47583.1 hypothetical protein I6I10_06865 [Corynebacterium glucuronolyticum]WKD64056.1 hypothetical protein CGLUCO_09055 [Corynebacterium glucuronolyticum DSM 44120]SMB82282.1 hypothetical protein SAMN05660745_02607 [Corynebacterium glucuronolyticum]